MQATDVPERCRGDPCVVLGAGPPRDIDRLVTDVPMPADPGRNPRTPDDAATSRGVVSSCYSGAEDERREAAS